ncbi:MAG: hypothetical protein BGP03_04005 [Pseudonocardia sp. 73-21]|nr:MAG: hypothetical protein BGP03_04005 [Pseudonocardia sp. 73-21]
MIMMSAIIRTLPFDADPAPQEWDNSAALLAVASLYGDDDLDEGLDDLLSGAPVESNGRRQGV